MKKKIAIIGASYLQLPLVLKAIELNLEVHCFAWEKGAVCKDYVDFFYPISIIEKEKILSICKKEKIDGITSIASDVAIPTVCFVAENLGLISNSYSCSITSTNKIKMREVFKINNINSPLFINSDNLDSVNKVRFPIIVKPTDRSGSLGVQKVYSTDGLSMAIEVAKEASFENKAVIEEFIDGVEVSVESISWQGKHYVLAITDKITTKEPYFVELEHHQPSLIEDDLQRLLELETIKVLNALDVEFGANHTEFIITSDQQIFITENGGRMGGDFIGSDLVELSTGYDFLKGVIMVALGQFSLPQKGKANHSGVYFLSEETRYLLPVIKNSSNYSEIIHSKITDRRLHFLKSSGNRSGYIIYQSNKKIVF